MRLAVITIALVALLVPAPTAAVDGRPNIVVVMLDDVASDVDTRLLERLPKMGRFFLDNGLHFTNAHGNDPLCCPGRANFLTGLYSHHHGVIDNDASLLQPEETIATALERVGYWNAYAGKYLVGVETLEDKVPPGWARRSLMTGGYYDYREWVDGVEMPVTMYSADRVASRAVDFLEQAPTDQPVFLMLSPFATHGAKDEGTGAFPRPASRHAGDPRCDGIGKRTSPAYDEADVSDKPAFVQDFPLTGNSGWPLGRACRAMLSVDEMFGRVRATLRTQGRLANTLFVLLADNGMSWGDHRWDRKHVPWASPLPLFFRWPGVLGSGTVPTYVSMVDLAPTLAEIGEATLGPYPTGQKGPDGVSLVRTLYTQGDEAPVRDALLVEHRGRGTGVIPPYWALRTTDGLWRYTEYETGERELYDLTADPWELTNVAGDPDYAETEAALAIRLEELRAR